MFDVKIWFFPENKLTNYSLKPKRGILIASGAKNQQPSVFNFFFILKLIYS
jgi:hypothetical protein